MSNESLINIYPPDTFAIYVGVGYIIAGAIFIPLQLVCSYIMHTHSEMQNPTYKLAAQLSLADAAALVPLCLYSGMTTVWGVQYTSLDRFMSFICMSAWYTSAILLPMIGFTRWIAITKWHMVKDVFTKTTMCILYVVAWIPMTVYVFWFSVIHEPPLFQYYPDLFSHGFRTEIPLGDILHWIDLAVSLVVLVIDMAFNSAALRFVHKTLNAVNTFATTQNTRRELLLLIQCFIISCVFALLTFVFPMATPLGWDTREELLGVQAVWILNHSINPLVYLSINRLMRKAFIRLIFGVKCTGSTVVPDRDAVVRGAATKGKDVTGAQANRTKSGCSVTQIPSTS